MYKEEIYNVVIVANDAYIQHAGVMLTSLFLKNPDYNFRVFLLTDGISDGSYERISCLCSHFGNSIEILEPSKQLAFSKMDISTLNSENWSPMVFYKLFMPSILPLEVERCLFLDVDMVINDDIDSLYHWNLDDKIIAGVEDTIDIFDVKRKLGLDVIDDEYINSGVMVCNMVKWREKEKKSPILDFTLSIRDLIHNEQDVLALYFKGNMSYLPLRWNAVGWFFLRKPYVRDCYLREIPQVCANPGIVHYCLCIQPWYSDTNHPHAYMYKHYLKLYSSIVGFKVDMHFPRKTSLPPFNRRIRNKVDYILNCFNLRNNEYFYMPVKHIKL